MLNWSRRALLNILICAIILSPLAVTRAQNAAVAVNVDAAANRRSINRNIYGVAHASTAELNDLNTPLNRHGGNNTTRYNWPAQRRQPRQRLVLPINWRQ